jgi:predicted N-acetyltransferase YhbS
MVNVSSPFLTDIKSGIVLRDEAMRDVNAREALLDTCLGPDRLEKTSERLREGRLPAEGLALVVEQEGVLIGTVRLWHVTAGPCRPALLLGPLAVDPARQGLGIGSRLMREALTRAADLGYGAVLLVGDAPYYERFGFSGKFTAGLRLPGPVETGRFLGRELVSRALEGARGRVLATGAPDPALGWTALLSAAPAEAMLRPAA